MNDGNLKRVEGKWEKTHREEFQAERKGQFLTGSGIVVKRLYTPLDLEEIGFDYLRDLGFPGEYPYTRGMSATMFRSKLWSTQNYSGYSTPEECNQLWKTLVKEGSSGATIAYDLPTQLGYDPDDPNAEGEVGRIGVSLASLSDWETAFGGLDIGKLAIGQVQNAMAVVGLASHLCIARKQGVSWDNVQGWCQNDILKEYITRGNYIFPPEQGLRLATDLTAFCNRHVPKYRSYICYIHYAEAGANAIHEAALGLADAFTYLDAAARRGLDVDTIAPNLTMHVSCDHDNFFEEIAKIRAIRRLYPRILKERFGAKKRQSLNPRWQMVQGGTGLHREQYLNNIARSAIAILAGALAGCDVYGPRPYDEQFGIPSADAIITGIRCSEIVCHETGVTDSIDPLGGSYMIESLTAQMEAKIEEEVENIERQGGVVKGIQNGALKRLIASDSYKWLKNFEQGEIKRVGVNISRSEQENIRPAKIYRADPKVCDKRKREVAEFKKTRDKNKVKKSLKDIKDMARLPATADNNMMPSIIEAVSCYATIGEIASALKEVWGEYH